VPELVALLDPDACFPAAAFCSASGSAAGESSLATDSLAAAAAEPGSGLVTFLQDGNTDGGGDGFSSLAALQQLGLRSSADLGTLVLAARYVEKTAREGDEDMAVARGKVCGLRDQWLACFWHRLALFGKP
jgi:hypothetical protein